MEYMTLLERDERMREEGRAEGRAEERINTEKEKKRADAAEKEILKLKEQLAKLQNNT